MLIYKSITADNPGAGGRVVSEQAGERASEQSEWVFGRARERESVVCMHHWCVIQVVHEVAF